MNAAFEARRAVESLRAGVPNLAAVSALGMRNAEIISAFETNCRRAKGVASPKEALGGFLIEGNFGSGKSHALRFLQTLAVDGGLAFSSVTVSKETPLGDLSAVYRAAISNLGFGRGTIGGSLAECLDRIDPQGPAFARLCESVRSSKVATDPVFLASLTLLKNYRSDLEVFELLRAFWDGEPPQLNAWKKLLRFAGVSDLSIRAVKTGDLAPQRFGFAALCLAAAGYKGWFIAIDEIELIAKFGLKARARAYASLGYLFSGDEVDEGSRLWFPVGAVTEDLVSVLLRERDDLRAIQDHYSSEGRLVLESAAGIRVLQDSARTFRLKEPDTMELRRVHNVLRSLYSVAYDIEVKDAPLPTHARLSKTIRQYVREWIAYWDLRMIDASYEPAITSRAAGYSLDEDGDFESAAL